jgi:hypothetical protein
MAKVKNCRFGLKRLMKNNLVLSGFAIILLFLAYTERRTSPPSTSAPTEETTSAPLFLLPPEAVTKISIRKAQQCVVVRKNTETLDLLREVSAMLFQGRVIRQFSPPGADDAAYGLTPATRQIVLAGDDDTPQHRLLLGRLNPVGNAVYARWRDAKEVLLVGSYFLTAVDVVFEQLRFSSHVGIVADKVCEEEKAFTQ